MMKIEWVGHMRVALGEELDDTIGRAEFFLSYCTTMTKKTVEDTTISFELHHEVPLLRRGSNSWMVVA
jgi:hypothetical protein